MDDRSNISMWNQYTVNVMIDIGLQNDIMDTTKAITESRIFGKKEDNNKII